MATYIVLLGPPGVGKGTQAKILSETSKLAHISSGDLFRENIKNQTELGKQVEAILKAGGLVSDGLTISMIKDRLTKPDCEAGAILDGFPRTPAQAQALEEMLSEFGGEVKAVPYITAAETVLVERASGRWTCRAQGHIYHEKYSPPKQVGICDIDGSEVYQREDDKAEVVSKRIRVYFEQTMPLVEHYRTAGKLLEIDGTKPVEQVTKELLGALSK